MMKTMMLAAAAVIWAAAVNSPSALAEAPKAGGGSAMNQTAEMQPPNRSMSPRYVWEYHYGHHGQFEGHWVLAR
jgi:hypothetical protein